MMARKAAMMDDDAPGRAIGRVALLILSAFAAILLMGIVAGIVAGHVQHGDGAPSIRLMGIFAGAVIAAGLCLFVAMRLGRTLATPAADATPRERRSRFTMVATGAVGALIGLGLMLADPSTEFLGNGPISPAAALILVVAIGLVLPAMSLYWHLRVADEQEAAAYSRGTLIAMYAYWIGAPVWWLLWRGGFVPAPDGMAIYLATTAVAGAIWLHGKCS